MGSPVNRWGAIVAEDAGQQTAQPNKWRSVIEGEETEQERRMRLARQRAQETTPDAEAEALKLSRETGLPIDTVKRNQQDISRQQNIDGHPYQDIQRQTPALAEWSADEHHAAIAVGQGELEKLGNIEWLLRAPGRAFAAQINRHRYSELRVKEMFGTLTRDERDAMGTYKVNADRDGDFGEASWFGKAITGAGQLLAQMTGPGKYAAVGGLGGMIVGGAVGSLLPGGGTAVGARGGFQLGARAGALYGGYKSGALQAIAANYDDLLALRDETGAAIDPDVAKMAALATGAIEGTLDVAQWGVLLKRFPGLDKLTGKAVTQAMKEVLKRPTIRASLKELSKSYVSGLTQESLIEGVQRAIAITGQEIAKIASGQNFPRRSGADFWNEVVDETINAIPTFALGMAPGPALSFARDVRRAKTAEQGVAFFTALGEGVQQSETATRLPAALETLVRSATKDGPIADVYVPVEAWRTYWQSKDIDPSTMADDVTGESGALTRAETTRRLRIPTARYAATIAGTEHNTYFANELALGPNEMNGREMEEFKAEIEAQRTAAKAAAQADTPQARAEQGIRASVTGQLVESGVPRETAAVMAESLLGMGQMAARFGFDPTEVFQSYGFKVERKASALMAEPTGETHEQDDPLRPSGSPDVPGMAELEAQLGDATMTPLDVEGVALNASGESAASLEAMNRQKGMSSRGEQFVVYDRAGRRRVLLGPDAVDYTARPGETYGVEGLQGFRTLDDRGGRPGGSPAPSAVGQRIRQMLRQDAPLPALKAGVRTEGQLGDARGDGVRAQFVGYQEGWRDQPTYALYTILGGEMDGFTVGVEGLTEAGIPLPPTPPLLEFNQRLLAQTPAFRDWFGASAVVDHEGNPLVVYHGTTRIFSSFDTEQANVEADFGAGFYFSNNPLDVGENYAGIGPDLQSKIAQRAEELESERLDEADQFAALPDAAARQDALIELRAAVNAQARAEFVEQEGMTIPVFLKMEQPAVLGGTHETMLDFELIEDRETGDIIDERGRLVQFVLALRNAAERYQDGDIEPAITALMERGIDGGITMREAIEIVKASEPARYFTDDIGKLVQSEMIRQAIAATGFDGIIDRTVVTKFGQRRKTGRPMPAVDDDTAHYVVFAPEQIKSAISNRGTFDPRSPSIFFQAATDPTPAASAFYSRLDVAVKDSQLQKATGAQWKATILAAKVGVNKDEFAITRVNDLDDATVYTQAEVLAYFKLNRPKVNEVRLKESEEGEEDEATDDELQEYEDAVRDEIEQERMNEVDWSDYVGTADVIEETEEVETGDIDENGDPIMEARDLFYPAVRGGYRARGVDPVTRQRRYGIEPRRDLEALDDNDAPYSTYEEAERAADQILDNIDREPYWETVSDHIGENLDWEDIRQEARRRWRQEHGDERRAGAGETRYGEYVLQPAAEEGTYEEVFITAGDLTMPDRPLTKDDIAQAEFQRPYADLHPVGRQWVDAAFERAPAAPGKTYRWKDGHGLYQDIENPIVRIRMDVRETLGPELPVLPDVQAEIDRGKAAEAERHALVWKYNPHGNLISARSVMTPDDRLLEERLTTEIMKGSYRERHLVRHDPGDRILFVEEIQPPRPEEQEHMAPIFVKNWREIGLKWAIREAARQGLAGVAWTTGQQQVERYPNIQERVERFEWTDVPDAAGVEVPEGVEVVRSATIKPVMGDPVTMFLDKSNVVQAVYRFGVPASESSGYQEVLRAPLGVVVPQEWVDQMGTSGSGALAGKQLKILGLGLSKLYDRDFISVANNLAVMKKQKMKVGRVPLEVRAKLDIEQIDDITAERVSQYEVRRGRAVLFTGNEADARRYVDDHKTRIDQQPAIMFTPELLNAVMGGLSLFQSRTGYRPQTATEIEALNTELKTVIATQLEGAEDTALDLSAYITSSGELYLASIMVPKGARGRGKGTAMMGAIVAFADQHNLQMSLRQSPERGKKTALQRFYRRFGFVRNGTGRFYDASAMGSWVRPAKQTLGQPARGAITFAPNRQTTITLFETANLSTFLHETGHFYLEVIGDLVDKVQQLDPATLTASQQQGLADYAAILQFIGVTDRAEIGREHHEKFARSFEAYLLEGKAPSSALRAAFTRFRAWLLGIYRSLRALNTQLTPEIRKVFDRLLASDEAIAEAEADGKLAALFLTPEAAGMSHQRFALYRQGLADASQAARDRLDRALLSEVQREQTAVWKAQRAQVKSAVEQETYALPEYRAIAAITRGTNPDGSRIVEGETPAPMKLSKALLLEQFGADRLKQIPKHFYAVEGGLDPGVIADLFGFESGDLMLTAITTATPMRQRITQETETRMIATHGSLLLDGTLHERAKMEVAGDEREVVLREELRALAELRRQTRAERRVQRQNDAERAYERRWLEAEARLRIAIAEGRKQAEIDTLQNDLKMLKARARMAPAALRAALPSVGQLRDHARALVASMRVRELRPDEFFAAARRASKTAMDAALAQDYDTAIREKQNELVNIALFRETQRARLDMEGRVAAAKKLGDPASLARLMKAGETYHDQVAGILDRYEFARVPQAALDRRASLRRWVQGQEANGHVIDLPEELLEETRRVNYQELTIEELVGITDGLKQIVHLSRTKNRLLKAAAKRRLDDVATTIGDSVRAHGTPKATQARDRRTSVERRRGVQGILAAHRKLSSILRELDGFVDGGPLWNAIQRPLNDAGGREAEMNAAASREFTKLIEAAYPRKQKTQLYARSYIPAIGQSLSKMERLMVALNWGNEGNRDRIRRGEGWSDQQAQAILDTLDKRDLLFVQGVFDFIGGYWPEIAAKQRRVTGLTPQKVEAVEIRTAVGVIAGGYFPLKYDDRLSAQAAAQLDLDGAELAKAAAYAHATTKRGHTEARAQTLDLQVRLDFGVMFEHVAQVIHDLTHHEALIDIGRVLSHQAVSKSIIETYGDITYKTIKDTVRDVAFGDLPAKNAFEKSMNHVRAGATVVGLAWNVTTAALQPLGIIPAMVRVSPRYLGRGLARWLGTPRRMMDTTEWIYEQSPMMKTRALTQQREINEIRNTVGVYSGTFSAWVEQGLSTVTADIVTKQRIADSYFYFIQKMQQAVDIPTWLGAYEQAMADGGAANGDEKLAVAIADQTVLDTQGGGQAKDLAGVQRGTATMKMFTNFYSYFSVMYNLAAERAKQTQFTRAADVGRLMVDYLLLFIVPASLGYFIREALRPGDDDEGLVEALIRENLSYLAGTMVGLRELSGAIQGYYGYEGPAGARVFAQASKLVKQIEQGELDAGLMRAANQVFGALLHYPAGQVQRSVEGFTAYMEGETENPVAILTGPEKRR